MKIKKYIISLCILGILLSGCTTNSFFKEKRTVFYPDNFLHLFGYQQEDDNYQKFIDDMVDGDPKNVKVDIVEGGATVTAELSYFDDILNNAHKAYERNLKMAKDVDPKYDVIISDDYKTVTLLFDENLEPIISSMNSTTASILCVYEQILNQNVTDWEVKLIVKNVNNGFEVTSGILPKNGIHMDDQAWELSYQNKSIKTCLYSHYILTILGYFNQESYNEFIKHLYSLDLCYIHHDKVPNGISVSAEMDYWNKTLDDIYAKHDKDLTDAKGVNPNYDILISDDFKTVTLLFDENIDDITLNKNIQTCILLCSYEQMINYDNINWTVDIIAKNVNTDQEVLRKHIPDEDFWIEPIEFKVE